MGILGSIVLPPFTLMATLDPRLRAALRRAGGLRKRVSRFDSLPSR
jgi:hypothetical protein